ncbi:MAG TPA: shikimate kinase, partial [Bdellovibrionales bacterium]|nr:shikimate kinase [Bdellovibrionales bacterium]
MRTAIIGHRGTGKTSLLDRIQVYYAKLGRPVVCIDLDQEVEAKSGLTISQLFAEGEAEFRKVEKEVFTEIDKNTANVSHEVFLACGGGFDPEAITSSWRVFWLRRPSDSSGRIFLDRPRLNPGLSPIDEFLARAGTRSQHFAARADETLWIDEGLEQPD